MPLLETDVLSNQDISSALLVGTYTATAECASLMIQVLATEIAGNGTYVVYATRQLAGVGAEYEYQPRASVSVASGITSVLFPSVMVSVSNTDIIKVYLKGLAGDTTTPDIKCEFWNAVASAPTAAEINAEVVDVMRTDLIPDSYAAHEAQPTFAQAILEMRQFLTEKSVTGTTVSVQKPDGTTAVIEYTLDDASAPTSITRKANP